MLNIYFIDPDRHYHDYIAQFSNEEICKAFDVDVPDGLDDDGDELFVHFFDEWFCAPCCVDEWGFFVDKVCKSEGISPHFTLPDESFIKAFYAGINAIKDYIDESTCGVASFYAWDDAKPEPTDDDECSTAMVRNTINNWEADEDEDEEWEDPLENSKLLDPDFKEAFIKKVEADDPDYFVYRDDDGKLRYNYDDEEEWNKFILREADKGRVYC